MQRRMRRGAHRRKARCGGPRGTGGQAKGEAACEAASAIDDFNSNGDAPSGLVNRCTTKKGGDFFLRPSFTHVSSHRLLLPLPFPMFVVPPCGRTVRVQRSFAERATATSVPNLSH